MDSINARQARQQFSELLDKAARGKSTTIKRHDRAVARIVPVKGDRRTLPDLAAFRLKIAVKGAPLSEEVISARREERY